MTTLTSIVHITESEMAAKFASRDHEPVNQDRLHEHGPIVHSDSFSTLRNAGLNIRRPAWLPEGMTLKHVAQVSDSVAQYTYENASKHQICVDVAMAAHLRIKEGTYELTSIGGQKAYFIRGMWFRGTNTNQTQFTWDASAQVSLLFEYEGRAVLVAGHPAAAFPDDVLKRIAGSFTHESNS